MKKYKICPLIDRDDKLDGNSIEVNNNSQFTAKFIQGNHIVYKARLGHVDPTIQSIQDLLIKISSSGSNKKVN
ncbi:hypothetical protein D7267_14785 [Legionella pneumophila]|nr:hypothetical protein D7267_14785 [Legionella pneumophila]